MKKTKILYWVITGIMAAFMLMASIPDVLRIPEAVAMFSHLGYPNYLLPFIGVAKIIGVIAVLVPGFPKLKEWAYAGLVFDLVGALYSHLSVGDPPSIWIFAIIGLILVVGSYLSYRSTLNSASTVILSEDTITEVNKEEIMLQDTHAFSSFSGDDLREAKEFYAKRSGWKFPKRRRVWLYESSARRRKR
jgi:uncharacterized membrane protein YphA (DoxX/SURF4 family)